MGTRAPLTAVFSIAALIALGGCRKQEASDSSKPKAAPVEATEAPATGGDAAIPWIEDDYGRAIAEAKKTGKPLVIDMWAPWCHTCLSMKHYVLVDPGLAKMADRFVWLSLDTDKETNAAAVAKFPPAAWPTFFVAGPDESVAARFVGSATVKQFREFLVSGERAVRESASLEKGSADWHLREAERLSASERYEDAAAAYGEALAAAPPEWPRRSDVLVSQISSLYQAGNTAACAALGREKLGDTVASRSASTADFSYYASTCAAALEPAQAESLRRALLAALLPILEDAKARLSVDDRSDGWRIAREIYVALGDNERARAAAETQRAMLDKAAAEAPSAHAAMTYNWPRSEVYVFLGVAAELVDDLEKSAAALPKEYDPPYRLAWVLHQLGRHDEALPHAARAVELVYGPRKARAMSLLADITAAAGDQKTAREIRAKVVAHVESLPEAQRSESLLAWARSLNQEEASP